MILSSRVFSRFWIVACSILLSIGLAYAVTGQPPEGWFLAGSHPQHYDVGATGTVSQEGKASAYLAAKVTQPEGFGTLMQMFTADSYRGKQKAPIRTGESGV